jgi:hypothetical protein
MVNDMQPEYGYTVASEQELNDLLSGKEAGIGLFWPGHPISSSMPAGSTGVLWKKRSGSGTVQPLALTSREEDFKRLCGRFAQLRSDLSPLTSWCHLLTLERFNSLRTAVRESDLGGMEAAWAGLVIAEAQLLSERPLRELRINACLATESFATARSRALWGDLAEEEISTRFEAANRFLRLKKNGAKAEDSRTSRVRSALQPIWTSLSAILRGSTRAHDKNIEPLVHSLMALEAARNHKHSNEAEQFVQPLLSSVPEAEALLALPKLAPEQRLKIFDQLVSQLKENKAPDSLLRHQGVALVAGYLTTIAAGGTPTLTLAESIASKWPEITGWAYVIGGVGERVTWTSGFEGLGRLVTREITRPFRLEEPPTCDVALDEAFVLLDPTLPDPLVHLRIKQSRVATIALFPGVNVSIPMAESRQELKSQSAQSARPPYEIKERDLAAILADAIWPHLRLRVEQSVRWAHDDDPYRSDFGRPRNRPRSPSQMPLKKSKD